MPSLQEIRNRLASVATTKKITKAMKLVATAKLIKAKQNLKNNKEYCLGLAKTFQYLVNKSDNLESMFPSTKKKTTLFFVVTSDIGLCGSFNYSIFKLIKNEIQKKDQVFVVGSKGISNFSMLNYSIVGKFKNIPTKDKYQISSQIADKLTTDFLAGKFSKVKVIYTHFINSITFKPVIKQILPLIKNNSFSSSGVENLFTEFEPNISTIIKNTLNLYLAGFVFNCLLESEVAEMSARRIAMEDATKNADDLIDTLNLEYNRVRQALITKEITEIIAGIDE